METCTKCNKSFYRSKLTIDDTGKWLKGSCPECGHFIRCLLFREIERRDMGNGLMLKMKYIGKDVKHIAVYTEDKFISVGLNLVDINSSPKTEDYFDMGERLKAIPASTAALIASIITDNIKAEFEIDTAEIRERIVTILTRDKSDALPFLARATALAENAMCQGSLNFKVA